MDQVLAHLIPEVESPVGAGPEHSLSGQPIPTVSPTEHQQSLETHLRDMVARVLRLPVASVDVKQPLNDLGLDSLMALELFAQIEKHFDVSLAPGEPATLLNIGGDPLEASRWSLRELIPGPGYVAALAVEGDGWRLACWEWPE